jgi:hypothetical protein
MYFAKTGMVTPAECPAVQKAVDTVDVLQLSPEVYLRISSTYYSYKVRQGLTASLPPVREATTGWCPMCPVAGPTARKIMLSLTRSGVYLTCTSRQRSDLSGSVLCTAHSYRSTLVCTDPHRSHVLRDRLHTALYYSL